MQLEFLGAAREVTGSCCLVTVGGRRVLVDCGLVQGGRDEAERNAAAFPFTPSSIDAVVLTHAHLDHSGRLPLLLKRGFRGPVYTHAATAELCAIMLEDAAGILAHEAEWTNRKRERKGLAPLEPLYDRDDALAVVERMRPLAFGEALDILPGVRVRLQDAGHILGSAIVELWLDDGRRRRKLVFSGDLGHVGAPILRDPTPVPRADLVILESTYGDRCHRAWDATWQELAEVLDDARTGNILIPSFAVGRTQELLYTFARHYRDWGLERWHVFLDSPLAVKATAAYRRHLEVYDSDARRVQRVAGDPFHFPTLRITETVEASMALNRIRSGAIIIAGSGMCTGGRIKQHLKHNVWRADCHVVIVGFQARGTLGRALVDGARFIRLWGETVRVAAQVHTIGGLSAHADQAGLLDWYRRFEGGPPVALLHGEADAMDTLAGRLRQGPASRVLTPAAGERLDLAALPDNP